MLFSASVGQCEYCKHSEGVRPVKIGVQYQLTASFFERQKKTLPSLVPRVSLTLHPGHVGGKILPWHLSMCPGYKPILSPFVGPLDTPFDIL